MNEDMTEESKRLAEGLNALRRLRRLLDGAMELLETQA